jgi:hypothetical protein
LQINRFVVLLDASEWANTSWAITFSTHFRVGRDDLAVFSSIPRILDNAHSDRIAEIAEHAMPFEEGPASIILPNSSLLGGSARPRDSVVVSARFNERPCGKPSSAPCTTMRACVPLHEAFTSLTQASSWLDASALTQHPGRTTQEARLISWNHAA